MSMSVGSGEEDPSFAFTRGPKGKSTEKIKSSARRICIYVTDDLFPAVSLRFSRSQALPRPLFARTPQDP